MAAADVESLAEESELENLFKDRFSESDTEYMEKKSVYANRPEEPYVYPWRVNKKRVNKSWDWSRHDRGGDRRPGPSRYRRDRSEDSWHDRNREWRSDSSRHHRRDSRDSRHGRDSRGYSRHSHDSSDHEDNSRRDRDHSSRPRSRDHEGQNAESRHGHRLG